MRRGLAVPALLGLGLGLGAGGRARGEPAAPTGSPLGLARGELDARLVAELGLRPGQTGQPLSLAPDAWYGLTDRWTIGITHSFQSQGLLRDGGSVCLIEGARADRCAHRYPGGGLDARWRLRGGALAVAPRGRLLLRDHDPWKPALTAGALVRWARGRFSITGDPYLRVGLAHRDQGNRAALVVPLWLAVAVAPRAAVALHTGWDSELAVVRDGWHIPIGLGAEVRGPRGLSIAAAGGFASLLGPQLAVKERVLALRVGWRR